MKPAKLLQHLYVQVLIGLLIGITVGHFWPEFGALLKPLGDGFVKLVKMMIAPVVFCGAGHLVERAGAAHRLFVQPGRHGDLPDAGFDVVNDAGTTVELKRAA